MKGFGAAIFDLSGLVPDIAAFGSARALRALLEALRARGIETGLVARTAGALESVEAAGLASLFDARLDGAPLDERALAGDADADAGRLLRCAEALGTAPGRAVVFEEGGLGVEAGRIAGFGLVVGVDRGGEAAELERAGADVVVRDLSELDPDALEASFEARAAEISWYVEQEGFDPTREHTMESLFAVGNGYLGVRGALENPLPGAQPDLFVAGIYDSKYAKLPYSEIEFLSPERGDSPYAQLAPLPFPFRVRARVEGESIDFAGTHWRELRRRLDLRRGVLQIEKRYETSGGRRTAVRTLRCASMADHHLLLQEVIGTPENHWSAIALEASLEDADRATLHVDRIEHASSGDVELVRYATHASGFEICVGSRVSLTRGAGAEVVLRRFVSVFTSRDALDPRAAVLAHLEPLAFEDFDALLAAHAARWRAFWRDADVRVWGSPATEQALRFASYHLRIAAGDDPRVSVPARALTGRAYEGHVFWDTEIFMLPFYLHAAPAQARNLLLYRHHTLEGARRRALALGHRGACFAWESTVTGEDVTPSRILLKSSGKEIPIFTGTQQVHVTADVAYGVWRYWDATHDEEFLAGAGAEILFETARFWTSRATPGERHYHVRGVVGPDEYHHDVNDNAYTNWMVRFNLERAAWVAAWLGPSRAQGLGLEPGEAEAWATLAAALYCPGPDARGVIEQFEGFFELDEYPLSAAERYRTPIARLLDWEEVNRRRLIKQADVLMLPLLFPEAFADDITLANYRYYEPITDHGSSLSPAVHAAIAARLGLAEDAERYFQRSLYLDLTNAMDNSALGVHPAAMAGTWQALVFGFLGVRFTGANPELQVSAASRLPADCRSVALSLAYRGGRHALRVRKEGERP